jgi:hypothetical protein
MELSTEHINNFKQSGEKNNTGETINTWKTIFDELIDFFNELYNLLSEDLRNSFLFITENKNYFIYAVLLTIIIQITGVENLGNSIEKYCSKIDIHRQYKNHIGGGNAEPDTGNDKSTTFRQLRAQKQADKKQKKKDKEAQEKAKKKAEYMAKKETSSAEKGHTENQKAEYLKQKEGVFDAKDSGMDLKISKQSSREKYDTEMKAKKQAEEESKANQKRISFFEGIKQKFSQGGEWGGRHGVLGPVFGNMEAIMSSVKTVFYVLTIILTIAGILSLPALIYIIITYMVIKFIVGRVAIL